MMRLIFAILVFSYCFCFSQNQIILDKCINQCLSTCSDDKCRTQCLGICLNTQNTNQDTKIYELAIKSAEITNNNLYRFIQIVLSALAILLSALLSGLGIILAIFFVKEKDLSRDVRILKEELDSIKFSILSKSRIKKPGK